MKIMMTTRTFKVFKEKKDPKFYGKYSHYQGWGSGESKLLYHIKKELNKIGFDVIKKRMCKDGHMVSEEQQYIRTRKMSGQRSFYIYDSHYSIRNLADDWNKNGEIELRMVWNTGGE